VVRHPNRIYVYKLSTGFDTSTATFAGSMLNFFDAAGGGGTPGGMHFSKDGMKFYQVTFVITILVIVIKFLNMI